ncbi:universal stress protein A [Litorivivens lipolytica]|uniref:Universal stress protein n=1 Tax=Litorivivens lipolytica TaxID=1524264 RepID=A0A7W4W341_9GAMM|nr:universal stress protein [Litorivivens lipolytica]MBB3046494.1 universal stress protein A [Litorivivens lipolytica]
MQNYQCVVTAIDLSEESAAVVNRANDIAARNQAALHLVHVIEPLSLAYGGDIPMDFSGVQDQLQEQAEKQLEQFGRRYQIAPERLHLMIGRPESQIHQLAEDISADLIVVGSHGRQGLALILGSTANGVLHGAHCDVLAVRVGE